MKAPKVVACLLASVSLLAGVRAGAQTYDVLKSFSAVSGPSSGLVEGSDGAFYGTTQLGGAWNFGTVFRVSADGTTFSVLHSFDKTNGAYPGGGLVQGSDGAFYGTTHLGGASGYGTAFKVSADGTTFSVIHVFDNANGANPYAGLVQGSDRSFYGTTTYGGASGHGTVFKVSGDGTTFSLIHSFDNANGANPYAGLVQGSDGAFYGATLQGGTSNHGTVFRVSADGITFSMIHSFDNTNGAYPIAGLVQGSDGALYGTTEQGGASGRGTVYKVTADGTTFSVVHSFEFDGTNGAGPQAGLVPGSGGAFYGTTSGGGASGYGTVFSVSAEGTTFSIIHSFDSTNGSNPQAGLVQGSDGALYGTTYQGGGSDRGTLFKVAADGATFSVIHSFDEPNGAQPYAGLVQGLDGALYGATSHDGASGVGTVFKVSADGTTFLVIHSFDGTNGSGPLAGLAEGLDGFLYGTTIGGGASGDGTVFKVSADGTTFAVIHSFDKTFGVPSNPSAGLVEGSDGSFYGTTQQGATDFGGVFKVSADGAAFSFIHYFDNMNGANPTAGLVEGSDGAFYGTTQLGGVGSFGTVFKVSADGTAFAVIHSFDSMNGAYPSSGLVEGADGAFYGTTSGGGTSGYGTVFRVSADGTTFSVIHTFDNANGANPYAGLVRGPDGALYGTTTNGGASGGGVVFKLTADGTSFSVIHDFDYADGAYPYAGLVQGSDGAFYGTTFDGGLGGGVVFRLQVPLEPTISIRDVSVLEGNAGTTNAVFAVTLSRASSSPVSVRFATADGTAKVAAHDYLATSGTLTFSPGQTSQTIAVAIGGDTANEDDETFFVNLSNPTNATITRARGVGTILNDDPLPAISITNPAPVTEGSFMKTVMFTVRLTPASGRTVTVEYATADHTATAPSDYLAKSGILTFAPGTTIKTVRVTIKGDLVREPTEDFFLNLTDPVNATLSSSQGVATILDDDPDPSLPPRR